MQFTQKAVLQEPSQDAVGDGITQQDGGQR